MNPTIKENNETTIETKIEQKIKELEGEKNVSKKLTKDMKTQIKDMTHLSKSDIENMNYAGYELINELHSIGVSPNGITKIVGDCIQFQKRNFMNDINEKFNNEIKSENFNHHIYFNGKEYVYEKYVEVESYKKVVEQRTYKTKKACLKWMKLKGIKDIEIK